MLNLLRTKIQSDLQLFLYSKLATQTQCCFQGNTWEINYPFPTPD